MVDNVLNLLYDSRPMNPWISQTSSSQIDDEQVGLDLLSVFKPMNPWILLANLASWIIGELLADLRVSQARNHHPLDAQVLE